MPKHNRREALIHEIDLPMVTTNMLMGKKYNFLEPLSFHPLNFLDNSKLSGHRVKYFRVLRRNGEF